MVKNVSENEFNEEVKTGIVFVDFFATWCGPCKMLSPVVESLSEEITDVKFLKVDVDKDSALAASFGIMSIPTLLIFEGGNLKSKKVGFLSKDELKKFIEENK